MFLSDFDCRCIVCDLFTSIVVFHCDSWLPNLILMTNSFSIPMRSYPN
jgi:hypothetical protein